VHGVNSDYHMLYWYDEEQWVPFFSLIIMLFGNKEFRDSWRTARFFCDVFHWTVTCILCTYFVTTNTILRGRKIVSLHSLKNL